MKTKDKFLVKIIENRIYKSIKSLPIENPYFTFSMFNCGENSLYILSENINNEMNKLNNDYIRWLYHICRTRLEGKYYFNNAISNIFIPIVTVYISIIITDNKVVSIFLAMILIIFYLFYFIIKSTRSELEKSYYSFYLDKFKNEAENRKLKL